MPVFVWSSFVKEAVVFVGLAVAFLKAMEGAISAIDTIDQSARALLARRSAKGLIIQPTRDEISIYSIQSRQSADQFDPYYPHREVDELIACRDREILKNHLVAERRVKAVALVFIGAFCHLAFRFLQLAL